MRRAVVIAVPAVLAVVLAAHALWRAREIQVVPGGLSRVATRLCEDGWRISARHPLGCREDQPHLHVTSPGGTLFLTLYPDGNVRVRIR